MDFYLQQLQETLSAATQGMTTESLARQREGKWSAGEILEHLYLTYTGTIKVFEKCLEAGCPIAGQPRWKNRVSVLVVVGLGHMPGGRKAPKSAIPRGIPAEQVFTEIGPKIAVMDEIIGRCEQRYGKGTRLVDHPILGPMTGQQWRRFHWVHGRHHVKQILRLKQQG
jgi:uncharacterized protein DUF1569